MAEKQAPDNENRRPASADAGEPAIRSGGLVGAILGGVAKIWNAVMADGVLEAAGRQGIDELGAALKPFPDSIQVSELGTLWSPTPGEIAADREHGRNPWPSEIANQNRLQPGKDHGNGHDNGHEAGYSM